MPPPPLRTNEERRAEVERLFSEFAPKFPGAPEITAEKLMRDLASEGKPVVVVDVRTEAEQDVSVIASALRKSDFEARKDEFRNHVVVAYCTIGYRSGQYVEKLRAERFDAYNLRGSILAWTHAGGALERDKGGGGAPTRAVHCFGEQWDLADVDHESVVFRRPGLSYVSEMVPVALKPWRWFKTRECSRSGGHEGGNRRDPRQQNK
jgi:sodium/bile acid cotransporter 7